MAEEDDEDLFGLLLCFLRIHDMYFGGDSVSGCQWENIRNRSKVVQHFQVSVVMPWRSIVMFIVCGVSHDLVIMSRCWEDAVPLTPVVLSDVRTDCVLVNTLISDTTQC